MVMFGDSRAVLPELDQRVLEVEQQRGEKRLRTTLLRVIISHTLIIPHATIHCPTQYLFRSLSCMLPDSEPNMRAPPNYPNITRCK